MLEEIEGEDLVRVTRCKCCEFSCDIPKNLEYVHCDWWRTDVINNGYCNYGEPKSNNIQRHRKKEQYFEELFQMLKDRGAFAVSSKEKRK